jgi:undecaprenyl phosphate N,N'-diacetylbacillosamine 1-phosphate transferase
MYERWGKRCVDVAVASVVFVLVLPLFPAMSVAIRLTSPGPILFRQERLGRGGVTFELLKFRTMTHVKQPRPSEGEILAGNPDVTGVGRLLRRSKLDELPQLVNVLRGDMSLVGPRPAMPGQLEKYDDRSVRRLEVRPGLTGLAQVSGNIYLDWSERWKWDTHYVDNLGFLLDCKILARTLLVVIAGDGFRIKRIGP